MIRPDVVNGFFEAGGAVTLWVNVRQLRKDKQVRGVHWTPTLFYAMWGLWNLYYYPSLHQWVSFLGGVGVVVANVTWLVMLWRYHK